MIPEPILKLSNAHPIVFFDGYCMLCEHWVIRLINADQESILRFSPLQALDHLPTDSIVLLEKQQVLREAKAVIRIAQIAGLKNWKITFLGILPNFLARPIYKLVSKTRYLLYNKKSQCSISEENSNRIAQNLFIDITKFLK